MIDSPRISTRLLGIIAVLLAVLLLRMTRSVTMPIIAGMLVAALVWPMLAWWRRLAPRPLALLATVLVVIATVAGLFGAITWSSTRIGERMLERRERLEQLRREIGRVTGSLGGGGQEAGGQDASGQEAGGAAAGDAPTPDAPQPSSGNQGGTPRRLVSMAISALSALAFIIAFMALALAESDDVRRKVRQRFPAARADRMLEITQEVAAAMQRYFVVKSLTSLITGAATLLITLAFGLDFALVWGLLAFLLEYVPTVGSVLAVIPPALYAAIQFDGYTRPVALTLTLGAAQLFLGNYVDPKIEGRFLSLSPFVVLASIVFWAWVWGAAGSLLGVPLTLAITTVARHFEGTRWIWAMLTEPNGHDSNSENHNTENLNTGY